jgi:tRNA(Ile)-lysidine synthase
MLNLAHLDRLKEGRVLLAFSGGVDSTALFHLLLENNIAFDIAHVNYHTRPSSDTEAHSAQELAQTHGLQCHTNSCRLAGANFEHRAREERYKFFSYLMEKYGYRYLLTAHQLNDRLEWLMMQLCRGSGLPELLGVRSIDKRDGMSIIRPLLEHDRQAIEAYLHEHSIPYHNDESNADERYTRNFFRHRYSGPLMRDYRDAIRRSFRYLEEDNDALIEKIDFLESAGLYYAPNPLNHHSLICGVDALLKSLGYVMRGSDKERLKEEECSIIGRMYVVWVDRDYTFVAPYHPNIVMDKGFKEECRRLKIEPKLRGFLYGAPEAWTTIRRLKDAPTPLRFG